MQEIKGDIFKQLDADAICVTTNGIVKGNGELVMGKGVALAFKNKFPGLAKELGKTVSLEGNHVSVGYYALHGKSMAIVSLPTKHDWQDPSDLKLIERSVEELVRWANSMQWKKVYLPRPGCQNGGLSWERQVKPLIEPMLDDRFYIITL